MGKKWDLQKSFVTVAPEEILDPDVLVRVLGAFLERRHVGPVLPVLVPEVIGVDTSNNQEGDGSTAGFHVRMTYGPGDGGGKY